MADRLGNTDIGTVRNNLLGNWHDAGYKRRTGGIMVRREVIEYEVEEKLGGGVMLPIVHTFGGERAGINLGTFRGLFEEESGIFAVEVDGERIPLRPSDLAYGRHRVEATRLTRSGVPFGTMVNVVPIIARKEVKVKEDVIPIVELVYEVFVRGEYSGKGKKKRVLNIRGRKTMKVGATAPEGVAESSFWDSIYGAVKDEIIGEDEDKPEEGAWLSRMLDATSEGKKGIPKYYDSIFTVSDFTDANWDWWINRGFPTNREEIEAELVNKGLLR